MSHFSPKRTFRWWDRLILQLRNASPNCGQLERERKWQWGHICEFHPVLWISSSLVNCAFTLTYPSEDFYSIKTAFLRSTNVCCSNGGQQSLPPDSVITCQCLCVCLDLCYLHNWRQSRTTLALDHTSLHPTYTAPPWHVWAMCILHSPLLHGSEVTECWAEVWYQNRRSPLSVENKDTKQQVHVADQKGFATCLQI